MHWNGAHQNMQENLRKQKAVFLILLFGIYMFEYTVSCVFVQKRGVSILPDIWIVRNYYAGLLSTAAGIMCTGLCRISCKKKAGQGILIAAAAGYSVLMLLLLANRGIVSFVAISNAALFCLGLYGGAVYAHMSKLLYHTDFMGKVMGSGFLAAIVLQMIFQHGTDNPVLVVSLLIAGFMIVAGLMFVEPWQEEPEPARDNAAKREPLSLGRPVLIAFLLNFFFIYYNEKMLRSIANRGFEEYDVYDRPRLFVGISALFVGCIGDIKKRKYVPITTLCMMIPALITAILPMGGQYYYLNMSIFYISLGAELAYIHLMFWDTAPRTNRTTLWAGMGRVTISVSEVLLSGFAISEMADTAVVGAELMLIVLILIVMAFNGDLDLAGIREIPGETVPETQTAPRTMEDYRENYGLTPKETEVLQKLITSEDSLQEVADEMAISRRVLQKHITSLYEKTGTKTRIGLLQNYMMFLSEKNK